MSAYKIWIGDHLPPLMDLNLLNLNEYMFRGSLIIGYNADAKMTSNGGTLLHYDDDLGMKFVEFRTCGTRNATSFADGEFLKASLDFKDAIVSRVNYTLDIAKDGQWTRCIHKPEITYMATGGFRLSSTDIATVGRIMAHKIRFINPELT